MRTPFDDFTPEQMSVINAAKTEAGWDDKAFLEELDTLGSETDWYDESFSEVCVCGHCEDCQRAINLAFKTTSTADTETVDIPRGCKIPGNASAQIYELRRMFRM